MNTLIRRSCLAAAISAGCFGFAASDAGAAVIQFVHEGSGMGTLDGESFESASFVITAYGDTDDRVDVFGFAWAIQHTSASITIDGLGTFDFMTPTRTFVNYDFGVVGFSHSVNGGLDGNDLFNGPFDSVFQSWDMLSSIGPVVGSGTLLQWEDGVVTSGGLLVFADGPNPATFTATIIPAPGVIALLGLAGLASRRRRTR